MRRAAKRDANEKSIVEALEAVGATVERLFKFDLLVGYRDLNFVLEVKNPNSERGRRDIRGLRTGRTAERQAAWRERWRGQKAVVWTVEDALAVIGATREAA